MPTQAQSLSREIAHPCLTGTNTRTNRLFTLPCQPSASRFALHALATPAHPPPSRPCPLRPKEVTFCAHFPELFDLFFEVFTRFLQNSRVFHVFHTPFCSPKPPTYPTLPPPTPLHSSPVTLHAPAAAAAGAHYICRERSTNQLLLCKTNPISPYANEPKSC